MQALGPILNKNFQSLRAEDFARLAQLLDKAGGLPAFDQLSDLEWERIIGLLQLVSQSVLPLSERESQLKIQLLDLFDHSLHDPNQISYWRYRLWRAYPQAYTEIRLTNINEPLSLLVHSILTLGQIVGVSSGKVTSPLDLVKKFQALASSLVNMKTDEVVFYERSLFNVQTSWRAYLLAQGQPSAAFKESEKNKLSQKIFISAFGIFDVSALAKVI